MAAALVLTLNMSSNAQSDTQIQEVPLRDQSYLRDLVSLSEMVGAAHAVREGCNGATDQYWRAYMIQLLGLEAPLQSGLRTQMVSAFNRGFEREKSRRAGCDASANDREAQYSIEGQQLAERLAAFYFPKRTNGIELELQEPQPDQTPRRGLTSRQ